jgi:hypothetical protein
MALKYIPQSWKDDLRTNFAHKHDFYMNPRGRVFPALTSAGISYIKNDESVNMRGTYRMQTGASTDLTYLYTLPQRFIIEGWFKPEFAYTAVAQDILNIPNSTSDCAIYYSAANDSIAFTTTAGGTSNVMLTDPAFASDAELQHWIYVRCFFDNIAKLKGFYCTVNGVVYSDQQNVPAAGDFVPLNTLSWFLATSAQSSYWIIHELDEALATGEYKTYQADRQIIFDFNGTTLGRERIRIPLVHDSDDQRGVKSFNLSKSVENPMTGSAGANTAGLTLLNVNGSFSDDQYDAFDPFQGRYNGTEKYLQNRVPFEIESTYSRDGDARDIPNGTPVYIQTEWATVDSWSGVNVTVTASGNGTLLATTTVTGAFRIQQGISSTSRNVRFRMRSNRAGSWRIYPNGVSGTLIPFTYSTANQWQVVDLLLLEDPVSPSIYCNVAGAIGDTMELDWYYLGDLSELTDPMSEPLFIGRTTPGAFKRNSPNKFYGDVKVTLEDGISELGETKLRQAHGYDSFDLSDPASEATSLLHSITRLVTQKEIRNYAHNSSFENATIGNSWLNTGMATCDRSAAVTAQFGGFSMRCIADTIGDKVTQVIKFETNDLIDVGDVFNFSAYVYQGTASAVRLTIEELTSAGALVGTGTSVDCGTETGVWTRYDVARTIQAATCTQLRLTFYAVETSTFYIDGVMLTRGIDPIDFFLLNATDGAAGVCSADNAATTTYDTVAIDADAVAVEHPYALVEKGQTPWDAIKKIGDASIASYTGMTPDGVLSFKVRYNGADRPNLGDIEDFGGIGVSLDVQSANSIKVHGVIIKPDDSPVQLWAAQSAGVFSSTDKFPVLHPIANNAFLTVQGATEIELKYMEDL